MKFMVLIYTDDELLTAMPAAPFAATVRGRRDHATDRHDETRMHA